MREILHICSYSRGNPLYGKLFNALVDFGVESTVYVPVPVNEAIPTDVPGNVIFSPCWRPYDRLVFFSKERKIIKDIRRKLEGRLAGYAMVHAHSLFVNGYVALYLKRKFGVRYLVAVRNTDVNLFFRYMVHLRPLGRRILEEAYGVIFLSPKYREYVLDKYVRRERRAEVAARSHVVPNGIDRLFLDNLAAKEVARGGPVEPVRVIFVGAVDQNKNIVTLIAAIELLNKEGFATRLTVVGKPSHRKTMQAVEACGYAEWIGEKNHGQLIDLYRNHHLLAVPSIHETFGLVYAEAMSQGLPVIYTKGQGFDGQFEDGTVGYAIDPASAGEIADAIRRMMGDWARLSSNAIEGAKSFDWSKIAAVYNDLYASRDRNGD